MKKNLIELIQKAINILHSFTEWEQHAMIEAQALGLQGEKRRERYNNIKHLQLKEHLQTLAVDMSGEKVFAKPEYPIAPMRAVNVESFFRELDRATAQVYSDLHAVANQLVIDHYKPVADCIFCVLTEMFNDVIKVRRIIKEGVTTGWDISRLMYYEISDENIHDKYEKKENDSGYKY